MDVEQTIQFMVENQARFDARLEETREMIGRLAGVVSELAAAQQRGVDRLTEESQRAQQAEQMLRDNVNQTSADVRALVRLFDQFMRGDGRRPKS